MAAPAPAPTPTLAASLPLLAAASALTGLVTISTFRPSRVVRLVSSIERFAFPFNRPPSSASTMRPSILAPAGTTSQFSTLIGSSRIAEKTSPVFIVLVDNKRVVLIVSIWPAVKRATLGLGGAGGGAGAATGSDAGCGATLGVAAGAGGELGGAPALFWGTGAGGWPCGVVCPAETEDADCSGAGPEQAETAIAIAATIQSTARG